MYLKHLVGFFIPSHLAPLPVVDGTELGQEPLADTGQLVVTVCLAAFLLFCLVNFQVAACQK